jgi:hypothetical protein
MTVSLEQFLITSGDQIETGITPPCNITFDMAFNIDMPSLFSKNTSVNYAIFKKIDKFEKYVVDINNGLVSIIDKLNCCELGDAYNRDILPLFDDIITGTNKYILDNLKTMVIALTAVKAIQCIMMPVPGNPWNIGGSVYTTWMRTLYDFIDGYIETINYLLDGLMFDGVLNETKYVRDGIMACTNHTIEDIKLLSDQADSERQSILNSYSSSLYNIKRVNDSYIDRVKNTDKLNKKNELYLQKQALDNQLLMMVGSTSVEEEKIRNEILKIEKEISAASVIDPISIAPSTEKSAEEKISKTLVHNNIQAEQLYDKYIHNSSDASCGCLMSLVTDIIILPKQVVISTYNDITTDDVLYSSRNAQKYDDIKFLTYKNIADNAPSRSIDTVVDYIFENQDFVLDNVWVNSMINHISLTSTEISLLSDTPSATIREMLSINEARQKLIMRLKYARTELKNEETILIRKNIINWNEAYDKLIIDRNNVKNNPKLSVLEQEEQLAKIYTCLQMLGNSPSVVGYNTYLAHVSSSEVIIADTLQTQLKIEGIDDIIKRLNNLIIINNTTIEVIDNNLEICGCGLVCKIIQFAIDKVMGYIASFLENIITMLLDKLIPSSVKYIMNIMRNKSKCANTLIHFQDVVDKIESMNSDRSNELRRADKKICDIKEDSKYMNQTIVGEVQFTTYEGDTLIDYDEFHNIIPDEGVAADPTFGVPAPDKPINSFVHIDGNILGKLNNRHIPSTEIQCVESEIDGSVSFHGIRIDFEEYSNYEFNILFRPSDITILNEVEQPIQESQVTSYLSQEDNDEIIAAQTQIDTQIKNTQDDISEAQDIINKIKDTDLTKSDCEESEKDDSRLNKIVSLCSKDNLIVREIEIIDSDWSTDNDFNSFQTLMSNGQVKEFINDKEVLIEKGLRYHQLKCKNISKNNFTFLINVANTVNNIDIRATINIDEYSIYEDSAYQGQYMNWIDLGKAISVDDYFYINISDNNILLLAYDILKENYIIPNSDNEVVSINTMNDKSMNDECSVSSPIHTTVLGNVANELSDNNTAQTIDDSENTSEYNNSQSTTFTSGSPLVVLNKGEAIEITVVNNKIHLQFPNSLKTIGNTTTVLNMGLIPGKLYMVSLSVHNTNGILAIINEEKDLETANFTIPSDTSIFPSMIGVNSTETEAYCGTIIEDIFFSKGLTSNNKKFLKNSLTFIPRTAQVIFDFSLSEIYTSYNTRATLNEVSKKYLNGSTGLIYAPVRAYIDDTIINIDNPDTHSVTYNYDSYDYVSRNNKNKNNNGDISIMTYKMGYYKNNFHMSLISGKLYNSVGNVGDQFIETSATKQDCTYYGTVITTPYCNIFDGYLENFFCKDNLIDKTFTMSFFICRYNSTFVNDKTKEVIISDDLNNTVLYYDSLADKIILSHQDSSVSMIMTNIDKWNHICVSYNHYTKQFDVKINNILSLTMTIDKFALMTLFAEYNHNKRRSENRWAGYSANISIFNRILTSDEIQNLMDNQYLSILGSEKI